MCIRQRVSAFPRSALLTTCLSCCSVNSDMLGFLCLRGRETCTAGVLVAWKPRQRVGVPFRSEGAEILRLQSTFPADLGFEKLYVWKSCVRGPSKAAFLPRRGAWGLICASFQALVFLCSGAETTAMLVINIRVSCTRLWEPAGHCSPTAVGILD